jgi:hypothetical protein
MNVNHVIARFAQVALAVSVVIAEVVVFNIGVV